MFTKSELLDAIDELEMSPSTFQNCEKLATFYLLYDHLYTKPAPELRAEIVQEVSVDNYGDSEFLQLVADHDARSAWLIMDELMDAVKALQPRLYNATLQRFKE